MNLWRIVFVVYATALTTGTHWPRLQVPGPVPETDKIIHVLAFGGLTFLLWKTRWIRQLSVVAAICLAWVVVDEVTQGIPGLGRTVTWIDMVASALGVVLVTIGIAVFARRRELKADS